MVAAEVLRGGVEHDVDAVLERAQRTGVAAVVSQTTGAGWAAAASRSGIGQERIRRDLDPDEVWTPSGGGPVWSNST